MHDWSFARGARRSRSAREPGVDLGLRYAQPAGMLNAISVLDPNARDDTSVGITRPHVDETPLTNGGVYTPQPYTLETAADGTEIVLTNQANAVLRYTARITDTTKFSPLFVECSPGRWPAMLAGPVIKGDGRRAARRELPHDRLRARRQVGPLRPRRGVRRRQQEARPRATGTKSPGSTGDEPRYSHGRSTAAS
jgi:hypothetical protein